MIIVPARIARHCSESQCLSNCLNPFPNPSYHGNRRCQRQRLLLPRWLRYFISSPPKTRKKKKTLLYRASLMKVCALLRRFWPNFAEGSPHTGRVTRCEVNYKVTDMIAPMYVRASRQEPSVGSDILWTKSSWWVIRCLWSWGLSTN